LRAGLRGKVLRKLKESKKKKDIKWKIANVIVSEASRLGYSIVLEDLGKRPAERMIAKINNDQLRHRIFQASFKGIQQAIEEKAKEHGIQVIYVNPRNTSRLCPIHRAEIIYGGSRMGKCPIGGEIWHRDVLACWNLLFRALGRDGSYARAPGEKVRK